MTGMVQTSADTLERRRRKMKDKAEKGETGNER